MCYLCRSPSHIPAAAKSLQSCPTVCDPRDSSPLGSPIPGILQARTLEWVAISFSSEWKWKVKGKSLSRVWLLATSWTAAYQAPLSMGFSRQEYWSRMPLPSPYLAYKNANTVARTQIRLCTCSFPRPVLRTSVGHSCSRSIGKNMVIGGHSRNAGLGSIVFSWWALGSL